MTEKIKRDLALGSSATLMSHVKEAALKFTLSAKELGLSPKEARLAADLMNRNAHNFLRPECVDGKASPNQISFLESNGFQNVREWDEKAANDMVAAIFDNDWRVPDIIDPATYKPASGNNTDNARTLLPEGDYYFTVTAFQRAFHNGNEKMPPCFKAVLNLALISAENPSVQGETTVNLFLHRKREWKLAQFFTAIGQRKRGEEFHMDWNSVVGSSGTCAVIKKEWEDIDGVKHVGNNVKCFYDPEQSPVKRTEDAPDEA